MDDAPSCLPEEALKILNKGKFQQALKMYQICLKKTPEDFDLNVGCGVTLTELGKFDEALVYFEKAETCQVIERKMPKFWFNKGRIFMELGRFEDAYHCFGKAYKLNPNNFFALLNQAAMMAEMEKFDKALECYNELILHSQFIPSPLESPIMSGVFYNRAQMLDKLEHYGEALKNYNESLSLLRARKWKFAEYQMNKDEYIKEIYTRKIEILKKLERFDDIKLAEKELKADLVLKPKKKGDFTKNILKDKMLKKKTVSEKE